MCFIFPLEAQAQLNGAEVGCSGKENMSLFPYIIAVDYDGTLFDQLGNPNSKLIERLIDHKNHGARIILNTFREGDALQEAIDMCANQGLEFNAINENIPVIKRFFGEHRKIYADVYIDDQAEIPEWE